MTACFVLCLYGRPNADRARTEQYATYSAYIATGLTGESHDLGSRNGLVVILARTTVSDLFVNKSHTSQYKFLVGTLPHARRNLVLSSGWPILNLLLANAKAEDLQRRFAFSARYELVSESETASYWKGGAGSFQERFPRSYGYLTFSRIGFNRDLTEALFYTEHVCGLCGEGKYVYMRKLNGKWIVRGESSTWIS